MTPESRPIIAFRPRTTNQCLDLSMRYFGQFLPGVVGVWLLIALPATAFVYFFARLGQLDLRLTVLAIYFSSLPLGVLLINDAVPRLFARSPGESDRSASSRSGVFGLSVVLVVLGLGWAWLAGNLGDRLELSLQARAWAIGGGIGLAGFVICFNISIRVARSQRIDWRTARMFFLCLCLRSLCALGPALMIFPPFNDWRLAVLLILTTIPGIWLALRTSFLMEQTCLERLDPALCQDHVRDLFKEETGELFGRATWIAQFGFLIWGVIFITLDAAASLIFRTPIFLGRLGNVPAGTEAGTYFHLAGELLLKDPLVLSALTATALLVYIINRLAWLFCYIDIRVRRDCWDLELQIAQATRRLSTTLPGSN